MAKVVYIIICALCCVFGRTTSAPIIKASGVQWSEPKGTGKGNITLIMIPQNNSGGNDNDMIVAVKSDYQIVSQDTQLLNLIVNENVNNRTNSSKFDPSLRNSVKEDCANKAESEILRHPNTAKYFESENKLLSSENTTNNTVNIYPLLPRNNENLESLNLTSTTISNTVNIFQFLNMSESSHKHDNLYSAIVPSDSNLNSSTSKYNSFNLIAPNNHSLIQDNVVNRKSDNISLSMLGPDDNFLHEALNILETLKQDPSYYNKLKSNQVPSTEEIKEHGDISLIDSKTKSLKSDDSALASDEGEGFYREFGHINQDISNLEGSGQSSTCLPFFMSLTSEQITTQVTDVNTPKEISFENVPLRGTGSNVSQELLIRDNASSSDSKSACSTTFKPFTPNNALGEISQTTTTPVQSYQNIISVGYGVQSIDSQTMSVTTCKPSTGLFTESNNLTPPTIVTSQQENGVGAAENTTNVSKGEPNYLQQTLAAAKNVAAGSELIKTDSPHSLYVTTSISVSEYYSFLSTNTTECATSTKSSVPLVPPNLEQASKAPSAGMMESPENQDLTIPQPVSPVIKTDQTNQGVASTVTDSLDGSTPQTVKKQNNLEITSTECISHVSLQTVSPTSTNNIAAGLNGLAQTQVDCVTGPNININQESGVPQAGVGDIPKKITLEPQVTCGTMKKEDMRTSSHIEGQEALFKSKDLTLPLVQSSIFLANNHDMPKGKDIPISLNASLDEFSLSDLQEKEDRMNGKVAELYNRNPILYNVEREPTGAFLKPKRKYYKSEVLKSPTFYFDKMHKPDSNQVLKVNFAGKNVILKQSLPSYKSESDNKICNNTLENNNKLPNYETEPDGSDKINVKPEPIVTTNPQIPTVLGGKEQKYTGLLLKLSDTRQPANEEDLLTILDSTTFGIKFDDKSQGSFALLDVSTIPPDKTMVSIPMPASDEQGTNPQESGQNNQNGDSGQSDGGTISAQLNNHLTTQQLYLSQTLNANPSYRITTRICSKPYRTKTSNIKPVPGSSKTSSSDEATQGKKSLAKEKISIPADSVQKIVIEIVTNTKKPENKPNSCKVKSSYDNVEGLESMDENEEKIPYKAMRNIKQNFVPFQSAWKPVQTIEKQPGFSLSDSIQPKSVYSNDKMKDSLKTYHNYKDEGGQKSYLPTQNNNRFFENQDSFKQEQIPRVINEFQQTATNQEKSLGANILRLLMADKSVVRSK